MAAKAHEACTLLCIPYALGVDLTRRRPYGRLMNICCPAARLVFSSTAQPACLPECMWVWRLLAQQC
jgi:hypothetical protein